MKIYIDSEFKCHTTNLDCTFREVETDFFNGKCAEFIEGYRFVPEGETRTCSDGTVIQGEMIAPWKPFSGLDAAQSRYERQLFAEYAEYLKILGVEV